MEIETIKNEIKENNLMVQLQLLTKLSPALQELNIKVTALERQVRKLNRKLKIKKEKVLPFYKSSNLPKSKLHNSKLEKKFKKRNIFLK